MRSSYLKLLGHSAVNRVDYLGSTTPRLWSNWHVNATQRFHSWPATPPSYPLESESCDILLSGNVLLHVPDYAAAIQESARVARRWSSFTERPSYQRDPPPI